jgi:Putative prokaryotic signal transducing protein
MEEHDEIIVFQQFENAIEASLAKAKLDAHGIPCFLTEENLATLYVGQSFMLFGVRLHLFNKDSAIAREILNDKVLDTEPHICPKCQSLHVEIEYSRKFGGLFFSVLSLLIASLLPIKKVYRCQDCEFEF